MTVQLISVFGALLCLGAYAALQLGHTPATSGRYLAANLVAGLTLTVVALIEHQWGFLLMEGAWAAIAAGGLLRRARGLAPPP